PTVGGVSAALSSFRVVIRVMIGLKAIPGSRRWGHEAVFHRLREYPGRGCPQNRKWLEEIGSSDDNF
ncbi:hypothetical protein, partial [Stenotrophomonas maltophilia]